MIGISGADIISASFIMQETQRQKMESPETKNLAAEYARCEFEAVARKDERHDFDISRDRFGGYIDEKTEFAWAGWNMARNSTKKESK